MNTKRVCPFCEDITEQGLVNSNEEFKVRNEKITVMNSYYKCLECDHEIDNIDARDPLIEVYEKYRDLKGYIQPQDLINFRHKYDLTQKELSHLLGFGAVTLSRYENGALQTDSHNISLEMAMQPNSLKMLVERNKEIFSDKKYLSLLSALERECENLYCGSSNEISRQLEHSNKDEFSGYSDLQVLKLIEVIIYMCHLGGALKTKLNKLLFYSDFYGYQSQTKSITGLKYIHLPYGPVPDNFDFVYAQLLKENSLDKEEVLYPNGFVGENFISTRKADLSIFNDDEVEVLKSVKEKFENFTSSEIKEYSHKEKAYKDTNRGEPISYKYAEYFSKLDY
jgi:putative zinc finger/helix-turn-helix YgiT family protein